MTFRSVSQKQDKKGFSAARCLHNDSCELQLRNQGELALGGADKIMTADGGLVAWAEASGRLRATGRARGELRFAFYGRVSTEDWQDR
jgi:hypothetical protein